MEEIKGVRRLFGEYAVFAVGLTEKEKNMFLERVKSFDESLNIGFEKEGDLDRTLGKIFNSLSEDVSYVSENPKTVIMSGFVENRLLEFLKTLKELPFEFELAAVLTRISVNWKLKDLLVELKKEKEEMEKLKRERRKR